MNEAAAQRGPLVPATVSPSLLQDRMGMSVHLKQMTLLTLRDVQREPAHNLFFSLKGECIPRPIFFWLLANCKWQSGPTVCLSTVPHREMGYTQSRGLYGWTRLLFRAQRADSNEVRKLIFW